MNSSMFQRIFALMALLHCGCLFTCAQELSTEQLSPEEMAKAAGVTLPRLPWHLADIWWDFEGPIENFDSFSMEISIDRDVPSTCNLYIAPVGVAEINGLMFYGGIQSNINGWDSKESRTRVHPGPGGIFSRWSKDKKTPIGLGHVRLAKDGLCESAGYEGEFCSVRRPFAWKKGTYTYSIVRTDYDSSATPPGTWFQASVFEHSTGRIFYIGSIRFEGENFSWWRRHAAFVEVYSTEKIRRSPIPKVKVTFGYPRYNGVEPKCLKATVHYNVTGPVASPSCAKAVAKGKAIEVEVGAIFKRDPSETIETLKLEGF